MSETLFEGNGVRVIRTDDGRTVIQDTTTGQIIKASGTPEQAEKARTAKQTKRDYTVELLALLGYDKETAPIDVLLLAEAAASGNLRGLVLYRRLAEENKNRIQPKSLGLTPDQIKAVASALSQRQDATPSGKASSVERKKRAKPGRQGTGTGGVD
ncbi:MAG: hypothetical protein ACOY16_09215 [Chloroflexota bacterium]